MKKIFSFILLVIMVISTTTSCTTQQHNENITARDIEISERVIVEHMGIDPDSSNMIGNMIADLSSVEVIMELTTQIGVFSVNSIRRTYTNTFDYVLFEYEIVVEDVLMDVNNRLKKGDTIILSTHQGIIKGTEFIQLIGSSEHAQKTGTAYKEYKEDEYIISSFFNAIPMEVGKTYLIYLTDEYLENEGVYSDSGRRLLYEYTDDVLYYGIDYQKMDINIKQLKQNIFADVKNRTGRADELGFNDYAVELSEIQQSR